MNKPSRILICGGRDYAAYGLMKYELDKLVVYFDLNFCVIHGGAAGADSLAGRWARETGVAEIIVPAQWNSLGKAAGFIRNRWMADFLKPELCIHFPGGKGTADMVAICNNLGIPTHGPL